MNNLNLTFILGFLMAFYSFSSSSQTLTARELADKAREVMENSNFEMTSTLRILDDKGRERVRKMWMATRSFNGVTKSLIRFREPAEVNGMAMLVFDYPDKPDDMWMYLPALRKERRIVADEKAKSFMGSEFSNNDLSVPETECFTYNLLGSEETGGRDYHKVEAVCKDDQTQKEYGYFRKVMWIDALTHLTLKIEFFDGKGQLSKIQYFSGYKKLSNGKYFSFSMTKENILTGRKSEISVEEFLENSALAEGSFSPSKMQM
jgi:hypothetical protein